jgi:putative transposase
MTYIDAMTRLRHYDDEGTDRFVTFSCYRRLAGFSDDRPKEILVHYLDIARNKHGFKIHGYVIMPEHVHLVLYPPEGMKLGLVIREIKSLSARQFFSELPVGQPDETRVFWERRCYDHNCRTRESVIEKINYCHMNPVKRGLVRDPGAWIWSSYNWYDGVSEVPLRIDSVTL